LTSLGIIKRLIPTKVLGVVAKDLWSDIIIPDTTKEVTLGLAAREEYHVSVRGLVIQSGVSAIRKVGSVACTLP
jgi:hypothetical protein